MVQWVLKHRVVEFNNKNVKNTTDLSQRDQKLRTMLKTKKFEHVNGSDFVILLF